MRTLAIETASEACSIALFDGDERLAHDHRVLGRGHAERLVPMIEALPDRGKAQRIHVSLGPGSFTGVRIGIAAARALGFAWGSEVRGYPTLALVAAIAGKHNPRLVTVCMNGGHGEWFVADFSEGLVGSDIRSLTPEQACERGAHSVIAGNRACEFAERLGGEHEAINLLPDAGAANLLDERVLTTDLTPIYGRGPDATPLKAPAA